MGQDYGDTNFDGLIIFCTEQINVRLYCSFPTTYFRIELNAREYFVASQVQIMVLDFHHLVEDPFHTKVDFELYFGKEKSENFNIDKYLFSEFQKIGSPKNSPFFTPFQRF